MADVNIFDSNIWKLGLTSSSPGATELVRDVREGRRNVLLGPYIYEEVIDVFQRQLAGTQRDRALHGFVEFVEKCDYAYLLDEDKIRDMVISEYREMPEIILIAHLLECQPKDAPVALLGWRAQKSIRARQPPTMVKIHTADADFADAIDTASKLQWISSNFIKQ